jgi:hypothetical protein
VGSGGRSKAPFEEARVVGSYCFAAGVGLWLRGTVCVLWEVVKVSRTPLKRPLSTLGWVRSECALMASADALEPYGFEPREGCERVFGTAW